MTPFHETGFFTSFRSSPAATSALRRAFVRADNVSAPVARLARYGLDDAQRLGLAGRLLADNQFSLNADAYHEFALTYARTHSDFTVTLCSYGVTDSDLQILELQQQGQNAITLINVYNDAPHYPICSAHHLTTLPLNFNKPILLAGDFNLHPNWWSHGIISQHHQASEMVN